jgi:hypothetical protein
MHRVAECCVLIRSEEDALGIAAVAILGAGDGWRKDLSRRASRGPPCQYARRSSIELMSARRRAVNARAGSACGDAPLLS